MRAKFSLPQARYFFERSRLVVVAPAFAAAHQGTVSYAELEVAGAEVRITLFVAYGDWLPIVDLDANRDGALATDEVRAHLRRLDAYARARLELTADPMAAQVVKGAREAQDLGFAPPGDLSRLVDPMPLREVGLAGAGG